MPETSIAAFETVEDPRCAGEVEHPLLDILVIAACAVLGEAEGFEDIALHGRRKREWLGQFLALPNGIPSHDTFRGASSRSSTRTRSSARSWAGCGRCSGPGGRAAAGGGRRRDRPALLRPPRGPLALAPGERPRHRARAGAGPACRRDRGRRAGRDPRAAGRPRPRGLPGGPGRARLPARLAERIVGRGGDHPLAREGDRRKAHAEVKAWFAANALALGAPLRPCLDAFDGGHGRLVRRRVLACAGLAPFATLQDWPGLATVVAVETIRGIPGRGKVTAAIRHYLSSAWLPAGRLAAAVRRHRRVENGPHRVLDVTFREDASRVRERNAARNLALLRRIALDLARADTTLKAGLRGEREYAGWDDASMATLMAGRPRASPLDPDRGLTGVGIRGRCGRDVRGGLA